MEGLSKRFLVIGKLGRRASDIDGLIVDNILNLFEKQLDFEKDSLLPFLQLHNIEVFGLQLHFPDCLLICSAVESLYLFPIATNPKYHICYCFKNM
jgi:hypothetical protein